MSNGFNAYMESIADPTYAQLLEENVENMPATKTEFTNALKTILLEEHSETDVLKLAEAELGKKIIAKVAIKGLAKIGLKGTIVGNVVAAAIEEPGTALSVITQLIVVAPILVFAPFVLFLELLWLLILLILGILWLVRANKKGKKGSRVYWDPENDTKAFSGFSMFMWISGLFFYSYTIFYFTSGANMTMLLRTLLFALIPDMVIKAVIL
jgi:hypothetical protein